MAQLAIVPQLKAVNLQGRLYQVTEPDGTPYAVTWGKTPTCDCGRADCPHLDAVAALRDAEPLAAVLFPMTPDEVLDVIDPSRGEGYPERVPRAVNPDDRAIVVVALKAWGEELRARKRATHTFDGLWAAACEALRGFEVERSSPEQTAEAFGNAAAIMRSQAAA